MRASREPPPAATKTRLRLLVLPLLMFLVFSGPSAGAHPVANQQCIATLVKEWMGSLNLSSEDAYPFAVESVSTFVNDCLNASIAGDEFRPLRIIAMSHSTLTMDAVAQSYLEETGFKVVPNYVDVEKILAEILFTERTTPRTYDGWLADSTTLLDVAIQSSLVLPLDEFINNDVNINWPDVSRYVRTVTSAFAGETIAVPVAGKVAYMYYRTDIFQAAGLDAPNTWEDFLIAARQLNGTDFNGDGVGDYAVCWQLLDCLDGYHATGQVMASMTQSQGLETGWLFDPSNLKNFVGSPAMAKTLEILREVEQHAWKGSCEVLNPHMMSGMCAMTVKWDELFKGIQRFGFGLKDKVAVAPLPGSSTVLDRQANMLVPCTEYLCPHAKLEKTYQGDEWVNRAPYFGIGGIASMLNVKQDPVIQKAAFDFIAHVSSPKRSMELVINEFLIGPFRDSHFDTSEDALMLWAAAGYNATAVKSFLQIGLGMIESRNFAMDLRILKTSDYLASLVAGLVNATRGLPITDITVELEKNFESILESSGPKSRTLQLFQDALGFPRAQPTAPPPMTMPPVGNSSSPGAHKLPVILGTTIGGLLVLSAAAGLLFYRCFLKGRVMSRLHVPGPGPNTTLVVTDISDSTVLWETLTSETMSEVMQTHHAVVRRLLGQCYGYEQATEGDSFLVAFHNPDDALEFASELQTQLLDADWPSELLSHPSAAAVHMVPTAAIRKAGGWINPFGLAHVPQLLDSSTCAEDPDSSVHAGPRSPAHIKLHLQDMWEHVSVGRQGSAVETYPTVTCADMLREIQQQHPNLHHSGDSNVQLQPAISGDGRLTQEHAVKLLRSLKSAASMSLRGVLESESYQATSSTSFSDFLRMAWQPALDMPIGKRVASKSKIVSRRGLSSLSLALSANSECAVTIFKGLRVRVGIHSGVTEADLDKCGATGRATFTGLPLELAKAVGDAGAGGMILLTQGTLECWVMNGRATNLLLLCMGEYKLKCETGNQSAYIYQAIKQELVPRLVVFPPLRKAMSFQLPVTEAPVGYAHIAFANMVGVSMLQAWNNELASKALETYAAIATHLLQEAGGYLVELTSSGLCLAAFDQPLSAVVWGLCVIEAMKFADWDEDLLANELCEEVLLQEQRPRPNKRPSVEQTSSTAEQLAPMAMQHSMLFRGPRVKIGVDCGQVLADVSPVTGRMTYRGRVMNRAARISSKAYTGALWCTHDMWKQIQLEHGPAARRIGLTCEWLGSFELKGIQGSVELVQSSLNAVR
mmetsp:Transcript_28764/g.85064  ORF Transcript_28764/g.85064 Transcript_28764/m.85064 type:complete len:1264 (-) Transcript_28764:2219-6010(-)